MNTGSRFEEHVRLFNKVRSMVLEQGMAGLPFSDARRGEEIRVMTIGCSRVFVDWVTRTEENEKDGNWSISIEGKEVKDWLLGFAPVFLLLIDCKGVYRFFVQYSPDVPQYYVPQYGQPIYLIQPASRNTANKVIHL
jgi:hypothetical protein